MSETDAEDPTDGEDSIPRTTYRTLGKPFRSRPDAEMNAVGWALAVGLVALLVPLLPVLVVVWVVSKLVGVVTRRTRES